MRFLGLFIFFWIILILIWSAIIWGQAGNPTRMSQWVHDAYTKKEHIAQKIEGRKIIIVSGSNALFGIDSEMLSRALDMPVINDAVNAGIGLPCILENAKSAIAPGDLVLMPLEYPLYSYDGKPGMQMIDYLLARKPERFRDLTLQEQLYLIWHTTSERIIEGYFHSDDRPITQGLYGAQHIDNSGDQNETEIIYRTKAMQAEIDRHTLNPEIYGKTYDSKALGWSYLSEFVQWCRQRNVSVIFMPSTLMYDESYRSDTEERWLYTRLPDEIRKRGWIYIGDPYAYMYDKTLYLNSNYHLIDRGRQMRTRQMIKDLNQSTHLSDPN